MATKTKTITLTSEQVNMLQGVLEGIIEANEECLEYTFEDPLIRKQAKVDLKNAKALQKLLGKK